MGRYMQRKGKISSEVAVMEVSTLGVRTRARTLALQRLQKPLEPPTPTPDPNSYLQLRSRRLEKPSSPPPTKHQTSSFSKSSSSDEAAEADGGIEVSFGENVLELEARDRSIRETTPCSLIRDSESIRTPASTTRNSTASNRRMLGSMHREIPTAQEMEEFFAAEEQLQHRIFVEKYNFDPVMDCPLPGRYDWVKLDA